MGATIESILDRLPRLREEAQRLQDIVLANLVAIGEVPAPVDGEARRAAMVLERFGECGLQACAGDEFGNAAGMLPGSEGQANILLFSNVDTLAEGGAAPSLVLRPDELIGPFVGDNALALAAMASLPILLDRLEIRLRANLIVLGAAHMLGRGNLAGLAGFLDHCRLPLQFGISLESVQVGRLNYACLGQLLCDLSVSLPAAYDWVQFGASGAIIPLNDVIARINSIPLPRRPLTAIIFGMIRGGVSYRNIARDALLRFEIRSESAEMLQQVARQIEDIAADIAAKAGVHVRLDIWSRRAPGGLEIGHPLVRQARAIQQGLGLTPMLYPTTFALTTLLERKVPALVLGLTAGVRRAALAEIEEALAIPPLWTGLAQLVGLLLAMDGGLCHAD